MMKTTKALGVFSASILFMVTAVAGFNVAVDPQCYYRCQTVDPHRHTLNSYYRVAQRIQSFPEAQVILLGSSRGETTPPLWIESQTGMMTLNLSAAGSELSTKLTFLKIAQENLRLRKVIWFADYFELTSGMTDAKLKNTPALRRYVESDEDNSPWMSFKRRLRDLQSLIDHNTLEASLYFLNDSGEDKISKGPGSEIDFQACSSSSFRGKETPDSLAKEVDLLYQNYVLHMLPPQDPNAVKRFISEMETFSKNGVELVIVINPYHPAFLARLKVEQPEIFRRHQEWVSKVQELASYGIRVLNYLEGIPGDDGSPVFWNDGVHYTCHGSMIMLKDIVNSWR